MIWISCSCMYRSAESSSGNHIFLFLVFLRACCVVLIVVLKSCLPSSSQLAQKNQARGISTNRPNGGQGEEMTERGRVSEGGIVVCSSGDDEISTRVCLL